MAQSRVIGGYLAELSAPIVVELPTGLTKPTAATSVRA